jgi:hypothetical protein
MSHRLISHLKAVRDEYFATRTSLALTQRQWPTVHAEPELAGQTFQALQLAVKNVEATYIARLFAEFEAILRGQYPHSRPGRLVPDNSDGLINGLGRHYRIPAEHRERVHKVRRFRHSVAHADPGAEPVPFVDALSWLNRYLSFIPDEDVP